MVDKKGRDIVRKAADYFQMCDLYKYIHTADFFSEKTRHEWVI